MAPFRSGNVANLERAPSPESFLCLRENQSPSLRGTALRPHFRLPTVPFALSPSISFESVLLPLSLLMYLKPQIPPVLIIVPSHPRKRYMCPSRFILSQHSNSYGTHTA